MKKGVIILLVALFTMGLLGLAPLTKTSGAGSEWFNQGTAFAQSEDEGVRVYNQGQEAAKYGRYQEALGYYERSLKIFRSLNHLVGISATLNEIGLVYNNLGQYQEALKYYDESLKIKKENNLSPESIATSLNNIGGVYYGFGQYQEAIKYYDESL